MPQLGSPRQVMQRPRSRTERCLAWGCRGCQSMEHQARRYEYASRRAVATLGHSYICLWSFEQFFCRLTAWSAPTFLKSATLLGDDSGMAKYFLHIPTYSRTSENSVSSINRKCFLGDASMRTGSEILVGHAHASFRLHLQHES